MSRKSPDPSPSRRTAFRRSRALGLLISFVIIPALLVLALVLPPISLPERIFDADYRAISRSGTDLPSQDGARLSVPPEGMAKVAGVTKLKLDNIARTAFTEGKAGDEMAKALAAFPPNLDLKSPVYQFSLKGNAPSQAVFSAPILNNTDPLTTLDFYSWDGTRWEYLPGRFFDDDTGEASLTALPKAIAIAQTKPVPPVISAEMAAAVDLPKLAQDTLAELNPLGVTVKDDGSLTGQPLRVSSAQTTIVIPTISNLDTTSTSAGTPAVRADIVGKVLATDSARQAHVRAIADFAVQNLLPGVDIYYAGLKTDLRPYFTQFVRELAAELHARGKLLTVSVPPPVPISAGDWDTGAYDWQAIGQLADSLKIPAVIAPNAYQPNGLMDSLLRWTVARVNRYKVQVLLDTQPQDRVNNQSAPRTYEDTLRALVGKIKVEGLSRSYATPQQDVKLLVSVADGFNGFQRDDVTKAYSYTYKDETGRLHTVSLETPESVAFKMALVSRYNLRGVAFRGLLSAGADASLWSAIAQYRQAAAAKAGVSYEVVWTVTDSKGQPIQVEKRPLTGDTSFTWKAASAPDNYVVSARIAASDGGANSAGADTVAIAVAVPSATLTPTPLPTALPTATARPTSPPPTPRPTSPPPAPAVGGFFGFGIQADFLAKDANYAVGQAKALGFGWVKTQIPYGSFYPAPGQYDFSAMDRTVTAAQAQGVRVLFSIVKAPKWSRPPADTDEGPPSDVNTYADFVRAVAARYAGKGMAYEIWNEENLYYEWGGRGGKLSAARYMDLLKAAYPAIKSVDPTAIVVSGAPTPTGWNDGDVAIDDQVYLQQMYANGLKNYSDAIGAHPSGFNCPALADWRNVPLDPNARFKGPINTPHPSFCFLGTMQGYRNIMVANGDAGKRIWATEFGWATVQNMGVSAVAGYEYASDNTEAQQALWITQAFQYGRDSGFTGVMFLWNLNYNTPASDEKSAFSILYSDGRPRPSYNSIVAMPK